jgi:hypothetical protein
VYRNYEIIVACFKLLNLGIIFCTVIDDTLILFQRTRNEFSIYNTSSFRASGSPGLLFALLELSCLLFPSEALPAITPWEINIHIASRIMPRYRVKPGSHGWK